MDMYSETSEEISAVAEVPKQKRAQHILASYCQATGTGTGTWDFLGLGTWDLGPGTWAQNREQRIENRKYPQSQEMTVKSHGTEKLSIKVRDLMPKNMAKLNFPQDQVSLVII